MKCVRSGDRHYFSELENCFFKSEQYKDNGKLVAFNTISFYFETKQQNLLLPQDLQLFLSTFSCVIDDRNNYQRILKQPAFIEVSLLKGIPL